MNNKMVAGFGFLILAGLLLISQALFTVHQVEQVLVVQLGKPVRAIREPGLFLKMPFLQEVITFDKRLLLYDQESRVEVLSSDKKTLRVDSYAQWRITDPIQFYQSLRNESQALIRLNDIIDSNLRKVLGQFTMMEIVSGERGNLMEEIRVQVNKKTMSQGIEVVDVRIKRADLPAENSKAVFRRMQTERERQAKQYRAEGEEEAVKIRSRADRDREVLLANAYRQSQQLRGEGDAAAAGIYAEAFGRDPRFFDLHRTLEAYRNSMGSSNTTLVLEPDGFFRYFKDPAMPKR
ncbi:MAG: protease modulator HflC [Magnetococcales bacterium]|nr:protease modulator HflC [Magnetococcales bacterium]